jgi:hypothetical protein
LLHERYPGSSLLRTLPPPSRLSVHFPLFTVIEPTLFQEFLPGTRRASPVARYVLATVLSLPPRRSVSVVSISFRLIMLPSPYGWGLGLRGFALSRPPVRSLSLWPGDSLTSLWIALSMGFRYSVSLLSAIQATEFLILTLAGLTPAEHASLSWTHNRTSGFPRHPAPRLTIQIICMQVVRLNHLGEKVNSLPAFSPIRVRSVIIGYHSLNSANVSPSTGN